MAVITASTFNPLLAHVNVRLQQGVPIVDADWNLQDDIRKFELRAFLKWFVGDGVPDGNDGFRIAAGDTNSFKIKAGNQGPSGSLPNDEAALRQVGRFITDGLDVFLRSDLEFTAQPLHQDQPGAAALATRLGVPVIARLTTPNASQTVRVELDVWERLLTPDERPDLIHTALGVETCARTQREWVVRAYPESNIPARIAGHSYATLATLNRPASQPAIPDGQIVDRRQRRLLMPPASLVTDLLGVDPYEYRAGGYRPPVNLRKALNALLSGQMPTTDDISVSPGDGSDLIRRAFVLDAQNGLAAFWISPRVSATQQIVGARLNLANPEAGFAPAVAVTSGALRTEPTAVALPNGEVIVAYQTGPVGDPNTRVAYKRAAVDQLPGAGELTLTATTTTAEETPFAVLSGDIVTIFIHQGGSPGGWFYKRYRHTDSQFIDNAMVPLLTGTANAGAANGLHAAAAGGVVWWAFVTSTGNTMTMGRLNPTVTSGTVVDHVVSSPLAGTDPFMVAVSGTEASVFYKDTSIKQVNAQSGSWQTGSSIVTVPASEADIQPAAVRDANGTVSLVVARPVTGAGNEIFLRRRDPSTGFWSVTQQIVANPAADQNPHPVLVPGHGIWVFWRSDRPGNPNFDLYAKRIVTAI